MGETMFKAFEERKAEIIEKFGRGSGSEAEVFAVAVIEELSVEKGITIHMNKLEAIQGTYADKNAELLTAIMEG